MSNLVSRAARFAWFFLAAVGCVHPGVDPALHPSYSAVAARAPATAKAEPQPADAEATDTAAAPPRIELNHGLIVGNGEKLELWSAEGAAHETISTGPALHPRRISADAVLALTSEDITQGAQLVQISLQDGTRTRIADLPAYACSNANPDEQYLLGLDVQDASDFVVDLERRIACVTVMDRNTNMANVQVQVRVELDTGRVERWQTVGEPECKRPPGVHSDDPPDSVWCESPAYVTPEPAATHPFQFDDETGWLIRHGEKASKHALLPEFMVEQVSPSGRWLVLGGNVQEADYIHRNLVLCDREDGALYPVLAEPRAWPPPLTAAAQSGEITIPEEGMADVVGESDIRWLSVSPELELLIVDQLVIRPKVASWAFEGELAR